MTKKVTLLAATALAIAIAVPAFAQTAGAPTGAVQQSVNQPVTGVTETVKRTTQPSPVEKLEAEKGKAETATGMAKDAAKPAKN